MLEIKNLRKVIVRVDSGSGIILKNNDHKISYVLTAYHCIRESIDNNEEIELYNDDNEKYAVNNIHSDVKKDIAVLEIDYADEIPIIEYSDNIKPDDNVIFTGYPHKAEGKRKSLNGSVIEWNNNKASINVPDISGSYIDDETADEVIVGFSGSGVLKKHGNYASLIGIMKSLPEKEFYYKEISCISVEDILNFLKNEKISILKKLTDPKKYNAKREFQAKNYDKAKLIFEELMINDEESKVLYIISSLSDQKISSIKKREIDKLYTLSESITSEKYYKISNFLWLTLFYEYSTTYSIPQKLDSKHPKRRTFAFKNRLNPEERKILSDINHVSPKSGYLKYL